MNIEPPPPQPPPPPIAVDKKGEWYKVERLLECRDCKSGKKEYLVKWQGYDIKQATWEPHGNILDPKLIEVFSINLMKFNLILFKFSRISITESRIRRQRDLVYSIASAGGPHRARRDKHHYRHLRLMHWDRHVQKRVKRLLTTKTTRFFGRRKKEKFKKRKNSKDIGAWTLRPETWFREFVDGWRH